MRRNLVMHMSLAAIVAIAVTACSDSGTAPVNSPLAGLAKVESNDSATVTPAPGSTEPGTFHGYVLGLAVAAGSDTISNAVRLAGVKVTAYVYLGEYNADGTAKVGAPVASVVSNANGEWQLPTLDGGTYAVVFEPQPPNDGWRGAWTVATVGSTSGTYPWWIYLPRK